MNDLTAHNAKLEILRINKFIKAPVILIGGLAVQQYVSARSSQDIDIICTLAQQQQLLAEAYPTDQYEVENTQSDLRPNVVIRNVTNGVIISLGAKITEREPYQYVDFSQFAQHSSPYIYDQQRADKVLVPEPFLLAFSKVISFITRRNSSKGQQDLEDFVNLTNHQQFALNRFIGWVDRAKAGEYLRKFFEETELQEGELQILRRCSPVRFQGLVPITLKKKSLSEIGPGLEAEKLIRNINMLLNSPVATQLSPLFAAVNELQFTKDVIRRNWDIRIGFDVSLREQGEIIEIIEWEYELMNIRSHTVLHEMGLIHSSETEDGRTSRIFTVLPDGRRQEIAFSEISSFEGHHFKREKTELSIEPGKPYFITLYYKNFWHVNPRRPFILNATTSKEPCLNCRIRFSVPSGFRVSVLNRSIIEPNLIDDVYDVRLPWPLLAEQKIEYVLEETTT